MNNLNSNSEVIITIDVDWAPEVVIADTINLLSQYDAKATFFCTHASTEILGHNNKNFEIAIHPNFNSFLIKDSVNTKCVDSILDELLDIYPSARGVRSHSLFQASSLLYKFNERKLLYDANIFMPYQKIKPFSLWMNLMRIPYNWEDDGHWAYGYSFNDFNLDFGAGNLNVLTFHPVHIYLNTEKQDRYDSAKKYYQDASKLLEFRNQNNISGTRDIFIALLKRVKEVGCKTSTLLEAAQKFKMERE